MIDERVWTYRATLLMHMAGLDKRRIHKILNETFNIDISLNTINHWLYHSNKPRFKPTVLEKSLLYHQAYKIALMLAKQGYGHKKISSMISRQLPIRIPPLTVYFWIKGKSKPNVNQVRICPELGYLVGVLMSDLYRKRAKLHVKDRDFAEEFRRALEKVTGRRYKDPREYSNYYLVNTRNRWLHELYKSGLWKVIAILYTREFFEGLLDGDGGVSPKIEHERLTGYVIHLRTGKRELKDFVTKILEKHGISYTITKKDSEIRIIRGRIYRFGKCWQIRVYIHTLEKARVVLRILGFRMKRKKQMLNLLTYLLQYPPAARYRVFTKYYIRVKRGRSYRWVPRFDFSPPSLPSTHLAHQVLAVTQVLGLGGWVEPGKPAMLAMPRAP